MTKIFDFLFFIICFLSITGFLYLKRKNLFTSHTPTNIILALFYLFVFCFLGINIYVAYSNLFLDTNYNLFVPVGV
jgi:hypothetical protein